MTRISSLAAALLLAGACGVAHAQASPAVAMADTQGAAASLPSKIDGHWVLTNTGMWFSLTQRFKLEDIRAHADGTFDATLSWWSSYDRCSVEDLPVRGTVTPDGVSFEAATKCYTAVSRLSRKGSRWVGEARFKDAPDSPPMALTAR